MSEKKWTPGPWVFDGTGPHNVFGCDISNSLGDSIAGSWHGRDEVAKANAHLIAAAPELYDALEEMLRIVGGYEYPETAKMARAALTKARGESK